MKKILVLFVATAVIFSCCVTSYSHPGGTDQYGGHYDSSTGEYHYHHGYSEHQHYDMNGDGTIDCPYDFKDISGSSSSSSSGSSSASGNVSRSVANEQTNLNHENHEQKKNSAPQNKYAVFALLFVFFAVIFVIFIIIKNERKKREYKEKLKDGIPNLRSDLYELKRRECEVKSIRLSYMKREVSSLERRLFSLKELYDSNKSITPERYAGVPLDSYMTSSGLPRQKYVESIEEDKYYFCINLQTNTLHCKSCRYAAGIDPLNIYRIKQLRKGNKINLCKVCQPCTPDIDWVDKYKSIMGIIDMLNGVDDEE